MHKENWLFKFEEKEGSHLFVAFADERYSGDFYHGCIKNKPSIRESIDLAKSKAKTSNLSIQIPDFSYQGLPISEQLLGGSYHYINQAVSVYSSTTSVVQIGSFRLIDISTNGDLVTLSLTSHRPWDFISIPQDKTIKSDNDRGTTTYFPVVYGDFSANVSSQSAPDLCYAEVAGQSNHFFPCPIHKYNTQDIFCLMPESDAGNSSNSHNSAVPHVYEKNIDAFVPLLNSSGNTYDNNTETYQGGNAIRAPLNLYRAFIFKPEREDSTNDFSTDPEEAYDLDTSTSATYPTESYTPTAGVESTHTEDINLVTDIPQIDGKITYIKVSMKGYGNVNGAASAGTLGNEMLYRKLDDSGWTTMATLLESGTDPVSLGFDDSTAGAATHTTADLISQVTGGLLPSSFTIQNSLSWDYGNLNDGKSGNYIVGRVHDVAFSVRAKLSFSENEANASYNKINSLKTLYSGGDGLKHGITGLVGNAITTIHHAHLDLLNRFAGLDVATNPETDIEGWGDGTDGLLDDNKSGWSVRWWTLDTIELQKALEKLQYEGGFIFRYKMDGTPQYIHIKDSYSSSDVDATLTKQDVQNIVVKHTPFSELLTKMEINYEKHPAEKKYLSSSTHVVAGDAVRDNWNIQTKENIKEIMLDALVDSIGSTGLDQDPSNGFADYYANIFGDIKLMISGDIVNVGHLGLQVGNIV